MPASISPFDLIQAVQAKPSVQIVDVRRKPVFEASDRMIAGASWCNPEKISEWMTVLDPSRPVVVYCAHGHQVSQGCAAELQNAGFQVAYLDGGFEQWAAQGQLVIATPDQGQS